MFFSTISNTCAVTLALLADLKVKVTKKTAVETIKNHPNFPSLLSISDALKQWKVANAVVRINQEQLTELAVPFITQINKNNSKFIAVTDYNETHISYKEKAGKSIVQMPLNDFRKEWSGIILLAEAATNAGEQHYNSQRRKALIACLKIPATICLFLLFGSILIYTNYTLLSNSFLKGLSLFVILKIIGIAITTVLLAYEIDSNNPMLQKICSIGKRTNCNSVLQSKGAKLFNFISWSEIGFFYFTGTFFSLLFSGDSAAVIIPVLSLLNIIGLPYILFSIFYQWRIAKQWCILCLIIQFLLLCEGLTAFTYQLYPYQHFTTASYIIALQFVFIACSIVILAWIIVKPYLLHAQEGKIIKRNFIRLKLDPDVFNLLLKKQKPLLPDINALAITMGNPDATHTITIVSNPYCIYCTKVHNQLETLLNEDDIKAQIIFRTDVNKNNSQLPAAHLLALLEKSDNTIIENILHEWYIVTERDYKSFASKYPVDIKALDLQKTKLDAMNQWCEKMNIIFTPMIFVDGYKLPAEYHMEDLGYLL